MESNEERKIGLYYISDKNGRGRVTSFIEYPNDLYAATAFKKFLESDEGQKFPIIGKLELRRLCFVGQVSDMALFNSLNITLCNAKNVDEVIRIFTEIDEKENE